VKVNEVLEACGARMHNDEWSAHTFWMHSLWFCIHH